MGEEFPIFFGNSGNWGKIPYFFKGNSGNLGKKSVIFLYFRNSKAHGCQGSGSTLGLSRKQLAHELREGSGALRDETHPADSNFLQTETRGRQMSIDVHPSLRRCLEKKSNSQQHRNEKTSLVAPRSCERSRSHHSANGQPASIPLSSPRWRSSWPPEEKIESRRPRRRGAALMGSGR